MSDEETDDSGGPDTNIAVKTLQSVTPGFVRKRYALKFGLVLAIMALSIGGIGLAATSTISDETQTKAEERFQTTAAQQADIVDGWIQGNKISTRLLSTNDAWESDDPNELRRNLSQEQQNIGNDVFEMHIVNDTNEGRQVVSSTSSSLPPGTTLDEGPRGFFNSEFFQIESLSSQGVYVSDTYEVGGQQVVAFVSPTGGAQDRFLMVEVSVFDLRTSLTSQENTSRTTQVVNENTNEVMIGETPERTLTNYSNDEDTLEPLRRSAELRNQTGERAGVIARMEPDDQVFDEPYTVGYAPVEDKQWSVLVQAPRSDVFGFVQTISNWGLFATIAAVLLIGITGAGLGYSTSSAIDRLTAKTEEMREGDLDVDLETSRIDNIGRLYGGFAEMRDALKEQIEEAERARKEAEVSRAEALEMSNYLQEKAEEYSVIMQQCAAGDLTQRMDQDGENESMDQIAAEFNEMIEELEKTTGQLKSYVDEVEEAGQEVEQSANTVREASEQVADSIQKIAVDAENQKERLQSISETMDEIADELDTFAAEHPEADIDAQLGRIQDIAGNINEIADLSEETQAETDNVSAAAEEQAAELNEVSERANDLQRYAQPLRDILDRFETEAEHEFVFSVGPTGSSGPTDDE